MTGPLRVRGSITIPRSELHWRFSRSGGPGGQSVNTADSRVELRWDLAATTALPEPLKARALQRLAPRLIDGVISIVASEQRAQLQNRQEAQRRLVDLLTEAIAPPPPRRRATKPSKGAVQRRLDAKRRTGDLKKTRRATD